MVLARESIFRSGYFPGFFLFVVILWHYITAIHCTYRQGLRSGRQIRYHNLARSQLTFTRHSPYHPAVCFVRRNCFIWQDWFVCWWQTDKQTDREFNDAAIMLLSFVRQYQLNQHFTVSTVLVNSTEIPCVSAWKYANIGVTWGFQGGQMPPPSFYFLATIVFGYWVKEGQIKIKLFFETIILSEIPAFFLTPTVHFDFPPLQTAPPTVIGQVTRMYSTV